MPVDLGRGLTETQAFYAIRRAIGKIPHACAMCKDFGVSIIFGVVVVFYFFGVICAEAGTCKDRLAADAGCLLGLRGDALELADEGLAPKRAVERNEWLNSESERFKAVGQKDW